MKKYNQFIFKQYGFNPQNQSASFTYSYDNELFFTEKLIFDSGKNEFNAKCLDLSLRNLFLMVGVSYYKAYLAEEIVIEPFSIDKKTADFFSKTYQKGLREFFYENKIPIDTQISFPYELYLKSPNIICESDGLLVGIGGGKDSLVSLEILQKSDIKNINTWSLGHQKQLEPLVNQIGLKHYFVERVLDEKLIDLKDAYNGHVPISAILAFVGTTLGVLTGAKDVVVSNEWSANEATIFVDGQSVNHQYSKSLEFENDFQELLIRNYGQSHRYYSLLRNMNELQISEIFAKDSFSKYKDVFCSCNKAYRQNQSSISWCRKCPKCCFVFLALTPFLDKNELEVVFGGNPLIDIENDYIYRELIGETNKKPFECVGTVGESRWAMLKALDKYPELINRFSMDNLDADNKVNTHDLIPSDIKKKLIF